MDTSRKRTYTQCHLYDDSQIITATKDPPSTSMQNKFARVARQEIGGGKWLCYPTWQRVTLSRDMLITLFQDLRKKCGFTLPNHSACTYPLCPTIVRKQAGCKHYLRLKCTHPSLSHILFYEIRGYDAEDFDYDNQPAADSNDGYIPDDPDPPSDSPPHHRVQTQEKEKKENSRRPPCDDSSSSDD
jgi:hypothetical protein